MNDTYLLKRIEDLIKKEVESFKKTDLYHSNDILDQSFESGATFGRLDFAQDLYDLIKGSKQKKIWEVSE